MKSTMDLDFFKALFEEIDPGRLQRRFLETLLGLQNVDRGSLWMKQGDAFVCVEAVGSQHDQILGVSIDANRPSLVKWIVENGKMAIAEAGKDQRHFKELEADLDEKSTLILGFPLILKNGQVYGVLEIIDTSARGSRLNLDKDYLNLLTSLVTIASMALSNSISYSDTIEENRGLKKTLNELRGHSPIIGQSKVLLSVLKTARDYAKTDFPVLITGESGTGKDLIAQEIHRRSRRADKPFFVQNCSAIPETLLESELFGYKKGAFTGADKDKVGLFEAADGGTIFLDEIGDMPVSLQARILRVIQNNEIKPLGGAKAKTIDVRLVSATNKDLAQAIDSGEFREDLFYRLNVLPLHMPPLRDRTEDIPLLLNYFLKRDGKHVDNECREFAPETLELLSCYPWKGNVREMENFVKFLLATVGSSIIRPSHLPPQYRNEAPNSPRPTMAPLAGAAPTLTSSSEMSEVTEDPFEGRSWEDVEREYAIYLLEKHKWNVTSAAKEAGLNRSTFDSRLKKLHVER
ncbi:sigma-54-dependent Fis family transcriptional regulator [Desulfovibrio inopinatus]|uniref:sigma-54-dependent Fis family transcriptional regulator n=1 Tax=Desulfovibrio inopinatus TaxID=102109 RepID=UPI00048311EC|nr:sigma 54-interacting transcriptional regulator [Desulfovibrio inopinatus]